MHLRIRRVRTNFGPEQLFAFQQAFFERSEGSSFISNPAVVTLSVDGPDNEINDALCDPGEFCKDETVAPFLVEDLGAVFIDEKKYELTLGGVDCDALDQRRMMISGEAGGADNRVINK